MWLPREPLCLGLGVACHLGVQGHPRSFPHLHGVYTQPLISLRTYYAPGTLLGARNAKMESLQTHRTGGSHPLVLMSHTPAKVSFHSAQPKKEVAQPQGGRGKSRTLPALRHPLHADDPGRAPARSSQQRLPLNGQGCLVQRLPSGHLAAPTLGSLGRVPL